jgi:RHS repeat-associated protein
MFSTKRYFQGVGLSYYGYRFYQPVMGRWLTRDPLQEAGGINLYGFVQNNPVNYFDPYGLFHFGKRPLAGMSFMITGVLDDSLNIEVAHEHGFFDDGSGENIGFGPNGRFSENPWDFDYVYDFTTIYDDDIIREALGNLEDGEYSLIGIGSLDKNNCQDWSDRLREEYHRIVRFRRNQRNRH